jgi:hypothetical protein
MHQERRNTLILDHVRLVDVELMGIKNMLHATITPHSIAPTSRLGAGQYGTGTTA